jgi:hypothetical protein
MLVNRTNRQLRAIARRWPLLALAGILAVPVSAVGGSVLLESVVWTDLVNVSASGNALKKAGGCDGCPDAGARSRQQITGNGGYVQFSALETAKVRYVGLSNPKAGTDPEKITFAIRLQSGHAEVREQGAYRVDIPFAGGDVFRIAVESGAVKYYKNGAPFYRSRLAPALPLVASASLLDLNSAISNVVISSTAADEPQGG